MFGMSSKRFALLIAAAVSAILVLVVAGCGGTSTEPAANGAFPDGAAAEYYQETGQMKTVESAQKMSASDLGVPIYPGAQLRNGNADVQVATCPVGVLETTQAVLLSQDSVDKVAAWYKGELSSKKGFEDHSYDQDGVEHGVFWWPTADGSFNIIVEQNTGGAGTKITVIAQKEKGK